MSNPSLPLTRRDVARLALAGTASALLMSTNIPQAAEAAPATLAKPDEGKALGEALLGAAGYAPSEAQTREAMAALKGYPGAFAKARALVIPNDVEPAFTPYAPAAAAKKGASR